MPEIYVWRVQCRPPLGCGTTAITEVRVCGPTYIFTCRKCGEAAGGLVADVPEKDMHPRPEELVRAHGAGGVTNWLPADRRIPAVACPLPKVCRFRHDPPPE